MRLFGWICKNRKISEEHKWGIETYFDYGFSEEDGLSHLGVDWSCLRCGVEHSEGFTYNGEFVTANDVIEQLTINKIQPWIN